MKKFVGLMLVSLMFVTFVAPLTVYAAEARAALCDECGAPMYITTWTAYSNWEYGDTWLVTGTWQGQPAVLLRRHKERDVYTIRGYICDGKPCHYGDYTVIKTELEISYDDTFYEWL